MGRQRVLTTSVVDHHDLLVARQPRRHHDATVGHGAHFLVGPRTKLDAISNHGQPQDLVFVLAEPADDAPRYRANESRGAIQSTQRTQLPPVVLGRPQKSTIGSNRTILEAVGHPQPTARRLPQLWSHCDLGGHQDVLLHRLHRGQGCQRL